MVSVTGVVCPGFRGMTSPGLMVRPKCSKVHVGGFDGPGCTEQLTKRLLAKAPSMVIVTMDLALCPAVSVAGEGEAAEIVKSSPGWFSMTVTVLLPLLATRSGALSLFKSAS